MLFKAEVNLPSWKGVVGRGAKQAALPLFIKDHGNSVAQCSLICSLICKRPEHGVWPRYDWGRSQRTAPSLS